MRYLEKILYLKTSLRKAILHRPSVYFLLSNFRVGIRDIRVQSDTQLVIGGSGGTGNTFAVQAFNFAQSEQYKISHHMHVSANVIQAVKWNIPTLVLLRKPIDSIVSVISRGHIPFSPPSIKDELIKYSLYYNKLLPYQSGFVVGHFEELIKDYGQIIERLNDKFKTNFALFHNTEANVKSCFETIRLGKPGTNRIISKETVRNEILLPKYLSLVDQATLTHDVFFKETCAS